MSAHDMKAAGLHAGQTPQQQFAVLTDGLYLYGPLTENGLAREAYDHVQAGGTLPGRTWDDSRDLTTRAVNYQRRQAQQLTRERQWWFLKLLLGLILATAGIWLTLGAFASLDDLFRSMSSL